MIIFCSFFVFPLSEELLTSFTEMSSSIIRWKEIVLLFLPFNPTRERAWASDEFLPFSTWDNRSGKESKRMELVDIWTRLSPFYCNLSMGNLSLQEIHRRVLLLQDLNFLVNSQWWTDHHLLIWKLCLQTAGIDPRPAKRSSIASLSCKDFINQSTGDWRTITGWITPFSLIDCASSSSFLLHQILFEVDRDFFCIFGDRNHSEFFHDSTLTYLLLLCKAFT